MRPIDADALIKSVQGYNDAGWLEEQVDKQPTVDVIEEVHAHWLETGTGDCIECSKCGYQPSADIKESKEWDDEIIGNICPSCGAIMDGKSTEERADD